MRNELKTNLTWAILKDPIVIPLESGDSQFTNYAVAFDTWGGVFCTIQGYENPEDVNTPLTHEFIMGKDVVRPTEDNFIVLMSDNKDDEFCGQGGYESIQEAINAAVYIAMNGEAPKGFYCH